ncbi:PD40 domain-containing protein, partial [bacterium]|nr:PD40 domain-containing protein [bacterium]
MKNLIILVLAFTVIGFSANAQEKSIKEIRGGKYSFNYSYDKAIKAYSNAKDLTVEGQRVLAESYHKVDSNAAAAKVYSGMISTGKGIIPEDYYNYAMALKMTGNYTESANWMDKFAAMKPTDLRAKDYRANGRKLADLQHGTPEFKIEHQTMNTAALDFGTAYYKTKVVFASTRTNHLFFVSKYNWTRKPFWDLYIADVDSNQLSNPRIFDKKLNRSLHDGPACFSKDGTFMAFTRNNYKAKNSNNVVELQIWFSNYKDGKWLKPTPFIYNNTAYSVGQPCLTSDGNILYFASDMPGGFGGVDIYKTTKDTAGLWQKPINLGDKINTEGDEMFPFVETNSGVFLFASNGRFGLGGLDIFISKLNGTELSQPYNAGSPLNTQQDDFAVIVDNEINKGYFSTNRTGGSGGDDIYSLEVVEPTIKFTATVPTDVPVIRKIRETFPLRNYVFFNPSSTEIPERYVLLDKNQVKNFKEDHLEEFTSKHPTGRSARQMNVYYNVINILGNRMAKNPSANVQLSGSSMTGVADGVKMAKSVKKYLVEEFGIEASRITTEGRIKPLISSEKLGGKKELELLREGDRRVTIWSSSPEILMEFQSGPEAPLKSVEIISVQESKAQTQNLVTFNAEGAKAAFKSWSMEIADDNGKLQHFGPFTDDKVTVPRENIMGDELRGDYTATLTAKMKIGKTLTRQTKLQLEVAVEPKVEEVMRFSIIFEFDDARAIAIYEKYLTEIVTPKIPIGGKVIIRGFTDIIGETDHNQRLSLSRANDVRKIMEASLTNAGRNDVTFEVAGFGEDEKTSPFEN